MDNNNSEQTAVTEPTEPTATATQQLEIAIVKGQTSGTVRIENNIVTLSEDTTFEQWLEGLRLILWIYHKAELAIADYLTFGVKKWGREKIDQELAQLQIEATLVKAAVSINAVPQQLRFDNLDGDHLVELARSGISKKEMIRWARIAAEQKLTAMQLRFSIAEGQVVDRAAAKMLGTGVITIHGIRQSFDVWQRRVGGIGGVIDMDMDHKVEIMEELSAICEFGLQLNEHLVRVQNSTGEIRETEPEPARA